MDQTAFFNYPTRLPTCGQLALVDCAVQGPGRDLRCLSNDFSEIVISEEVILGWSWARCGDKKSGQVEDQLRNCNLGLEN